MISPKKRGHLFSDPMSFSILLSQQSQAYQAKMKPKKQFATDTNSHIQNSASSTFAAFYFVRPTDSQAYLAEAEGRGHIRAPLRRNHPKRLFAFCFSSSSSDSINMSAVMTKCFGSTFIPAWISFIRTIYAIFIFNLKRISAKLFRRSRSRGWSRALRSSGRAIKCRWCFIIICHIFLLSLFSIDASSANRQDTEMCPPFLAGYESADKEWHEDTVACADVVKFWTLMTFDQFSEAEKLLIGRALAEKKSLVKIPNK